MNTKKQEKVLIVYASSRGTTTKAVQLLNEELDGAITIFQLKNNSQINASSYDAIILGSSIHAGQVQAKMKKFIAANKQILLNKRLGLFLCCMEQGVIAEEQFNHAFPEELRQHSIANGLFGGELIFANMNFFERFIIKKKAGTSEDMTTFDPEKVRAFAQKFNPAAIENAF